MSDRQWHVTIGGNVKDAVDHGLTLKAKCGIVWTPTLIGSPEEHPEIPECAECHRAGPSRVPGRPHFVYRHFNRHGRLIYVGCTVAPRTRLEQHRVNAWWFPQVERTTYTVFPNREYALFVEARAIAEENPRWNVRHRDRSAMTLDDFRDLKVALTKNGVKEKRLERLDSEVVQRFGVAL